MCEQVDMMLAAYPKSKSKFMVYRNFVKALPWLTVVREELGHSIILGQKAFLSRRNKRESKHGCGCFTCRTQRAVYTPS